MDKAVLICVLVSCKGQLDTAWSHLRRQAPLQDCTDQIGLGGVCGGVFDSYPLGPGSQWADFSLGRWSWLYDKAWQAWTWEGALDRLLLWFILLAFLPRLPSVVDLDLEIKLNNFFRLLIALGHGICHSNRVMTRRKWSSHWDLNWKLELMAL